MRPVMPPPQFTEGTSMTVPEKVDQLIQNALDRTGKWIEADLTATMASRIAAGFLAAGCPPVVGQMNYTEGIDTVAGTSVDIAKSILRQTRVDERS